MIRELWLLLLKVSLISCMDKVIEDLLTPLRMMGETCGYASCPLLQKDMLNIHIVPHTHAELGHERTFLQHYTGNDDFYEKSQVNMKRILDYVITELWAKPERKFTFSDVPYLFHWWSNRDETVRRMVYQLLRQGRLFLVGGGWSMSDEATTSYHAIIDHFTYSLKKINSTFLECGRPLVAWQADCQGHSREFASLLSQMGFDGLFINPISFDDELERMKRKGMEFVWRGSDDLGANSDIFTHKLFDGYWSPPGFCFGSMCKDPLIISSNDDVNNVDERILEFLQSMEHRQSPYYTTNNIMVMMGKRLGYFDASIWFANIDKLIVLVNRLGTLGQKGFHAFYSTPACYLKAVNEENPKLQTKQDDFFPIAYDKHSYATGYYTSRPSLKLLAREGHKFLQITKQLTVTARLGNYNNFLDEIQWINGVFQDHSIITGDLRPYVASHYIKKMSKTIMAAMKYPIKDALNKLRRSSDDTRYHICKLNISSCPNTEGAHHFIVVYNPLAWNVSIPVRLPIQGVVYTVYNPQGSIISSTVISVPGHILEHPERRGYSKYELVFFAENIPPMGFRSYLIQKTYLGWERPKRSLIKKINQKKPKKYLVHNSGNDDELFEDGDPETMEVGGLTTTPRYETKIVFGNFNRNDYESRFSGVITPKPRLESTTSLTTSTTEKATTTPTEITTEIEITTELETTTETEKTTTRHIPTRSTTTTEKTTYRTTTEPEKRKWLEAHETEYDESLFNKDLNLPTIPKEIMPIKSDKPYLSNKYVRINLDKNKRIRAILLVNGIEMALSIKFFYYFSDDPEKLKRSRPPPGASVFRTMDSKQEEVTDMFNCTVWKTRLVKEYQCRFAKYASYVVRLYENSTVIEVDWAVGPIPVDDELGKDFFIKYSTNLNNRGVFFTDSNGRQTLKRIRNMRPTFQPQNDDAISGNFYPVTSKIHIEDKKKNIRLAVFTDRAQGGSSLKDGEIDLMIHRRILTDDNGYQAYLNETEMEQGVIVRGTHYLYISKADHKPTRIFEKKLAKEIELRPHVFVSDINGYGRKTKQIWSKETNEFTAIKSKLPIGVHILTLEKWNDDTLLLRLENFLEKSDAVLSGIKTVYLKGLFTKFEVTDVKETTLAANMWLDKYSPMGWNKDKFLRNFNEAYGSNSYVYTKEDIRDVNEVNLDKGIVLRPQEIRTFVVWYKIL